MSAPQMVNELLLTASTLSAPQAQRAKVEQKRVAKNASHREWTLKVLELPAVPRRLSTACSR